MNQKHNQYDPKQYPTMREYALPIYKAWDAKGVPPPKGYKSWVESLDKMAKR